MIRPFLLATLLASGNAQAAEPERWVPGWSGPPIGYEPTIRDALGRPFKDETVRQDLHVGITGRTVRIRLTNELSDTPLRVGAVSILRLDAEGKPVAGSLRALSFSGAKDVRIPGRAPILSDAIEGEARPAPAGGPF